MHIKVEECDCCITIDTTIDALRTMHFALLEYKSNLVETIRNSTNHEDVLFCANQINEINRLTKKTEFCEE